MKIKYFCENVKDGKYILSVDIIKIVDSMLSKKEYTLKSVREMSYMKKLGVEKVYEDPLIYECYFCFMGIYMIISTPIIKPFCKNSKNYIIYIKKMKH